MTIAKLMEFKRKLHQHLKVKKDKMMQRVKARKIKMVMNT